MTGRAGVSRLFAVGFLCASALAAATATATADDTIVCEPGQIVIDGQCAVPPSPAGKPGGDAGSANTTDHTGDSVHH